MKQIYSLLVCLSVLLFSCNSYREDKKIPGKGDLKIAFGNAQPQKAIMYVTAEHTNARLKLTDTLSFENLPQPDETFPTIMVDPDKQFQTIEGFGGTFTDASAETFYKLPKVKQEEILNAYFSVEDGLGYSLCRTTINSADWSSESYAYDEVPGDTALKHFSIDHDRQFRIPLIKAAMQKAGRPIKIFGSPYSPPAWVKTNNNMLEGGKLKPEYFGVYANYFVRFIEEYESEGINIWGLTVQNEPMSVQKFESCIFTGEEECDFIKNHLGPALHKNNLSNVNLMIWDHNRGIMYQRAKSVYDDPEAAKYVWGMGYHWYVGDHFDNVRLVHDSYPEKKLLFTEGTVASFDKNRLSEWHWGEQYALSMIMDLNNWAVGWVDLNLILDENGGPNHVENYCMAPMIGNTQTGEIFYMNSFYYIGHFTKFILPGARRIISSSNDDRLLSTSFINPDGKVIVVVLNRTEKNIEFKSWLAGKSTVATSPAHSILTMIISASNN
jgi:glucosylceramidase